jgi:SWIM/SEC-C metal-binding protein
VAKLGSEKRPAIVRVPTTARAEEILSTCEEHGWKVMIGLEPDEPEDVSDVETLLSGGGADAVPIRSGPTIGRNDPCSCGSGRKFKKCCGVA